MDRSAPTSHKSASKSLMIPSKHRLHHTHETKKINKSPILTLANPTRSTPFLQKQPQNPKITKTPSK
jgi:hypothetical protein